jgi:hypothetical protein
VEDDAIVQSATENCLSDLQTDSAYSLVDVEDEHCSGMLSDVSYSYIGSDADFGKLELVDFRE